MVGFRQSNLMASQSGAAGQSVPKPSPGWATEFVPVDHAWSLDSLEQDHIRSPRAGYGQGPCRPRAVLLSNSRSAGASTSRRRLHSGFRKGTDRVRHHLHNLAPYQDAGRRGWIPGTTASPRPKPRVLRAFTARRVGRKQYAGNVRGHHSLHHHRHGHRILIHACAVHNDAQQFLTAAVRASAPQTLR